MASASDNPIDHDVTDPRPAKRTKMDDSAAKKAYDDYVHVDDYRTRKGIAPIKAEFLIHPNGNPAVKQTRDDDDAEKSTFMASGMKASYGTPRRAGTQADVQDGVNQDASTTNTESGEQLPGDRPRGQENGHSRGNDRRGGRGGRDRKFDKKKETGQNKNRQYGTWGDALQLCPSRQSAPEFSPRECKFGDKCKFEHNLRKYLSEGKQPDLTTLGGECPMFTATGYCVSGWKCRFVGSHSKEVQNEDGASELVLVEDKDRMNAAGLDDENKATGKDVYNVVSTKDKIDLERRRVQTEKADKYTQWLADSYTPHQVKTHNVSKGDNAENGAMAVDEQDHKADHRANFTEPPLRASEKRRLYYGPETPVLAPLTTQGNMPFRRLCVDLGAQVTWSEMAMGMPIMQGQKGEWALLKAHQSEIEPPKVTGTNIVADYDNTKDLKFGVQIAANKPWVAFKTTEILAKYCSHIRAIDLNCGCPIDMVYNSGAGSALLDAAPKLEKILRGMNAVSGEIPITCKIRTGIKDNAPNAGSIAERLVLGGDTARETGLGPCGVAALTLHGRSRQQRYTKLANWQYIADIAALIKDLKVKQDTVADTVREADPRDQANGGKVYFIGNGDVYSHMDYNDHIRDAGVDSCMVARGALIKPWIFEEISSNQYLDKSATERLAYIEKFCKYGLDTWGSDEMGVGTTRRFLLEWLSFTCRYVPLGLLEVLPPKLNERPPPFKGRNEMETLLASHDYRDWMKISEMFLGPAHKDFRFTPKHKSNAYDNIEAEG